ncbi:MAG: hydroxysqualene dehydroxylase HpnE [Candidatus Kapaibacterium sp.]
MPHDERKWIIIGAGVAGISAAIGCALAGKKVLLIEQSSYLGGRARSFTDTTTGEIIDNGQHVLMGCYTSLLFALDTLGTSHLLRRQSALNVQFIDADGQRDTLDTSGLPGKAGIVLGILNLKNVSWLSKIRALELALRMQLGAVNAAGKTADEFLLSYNQTPEMIERFWTPIILATLNASPNTASASLLLEVMRRAFFGGRRASQILISSVGLSALFEPLTAWLAERGGEILLNTRIESLQLANGSVDSVLTSRGDVFAADTVIAAIPPKHLLRMLPSELAASKEFDRFTSFRFSPIVSVYLWLDRPFFPNDFAAMLGTTTQWIFNRRRLAHASEATLKKYPEHLSLTVSAGDELVELSPEAVVNSCFTELRAAFPLAGKATLLASKVIKEKSATFLATPAIEPLRPQPETSVPNLFLAGDWTATGLPATLEGASQSGFSAAKSALSINISR